MEEAGMSEEVLQKVRYIYLNHIVGIVKQTKGKETHTHKLYWCFNINIWRSNSGAMIIISG